MTYAASLDETRNAVDKLRREIETERQNLAVEQERQDIWTKNSEERLIHMRQETQRAQREIDSLGQVRDRLLASRQAEGNAKAEAKLAEQQIAGSIADQIALLKARIATQELPTLAEIKVKEMGDIERGLRAGLLSPEDGLGRALDQLGDMIDDGGKVSSKVGTYTTQKGLALPGTYVTAGGIFEAFVSDDGQLGAYRLKTDSVWIWKETLNAERRMNLQKIAGMIKGTEKPGFVALPIGLAGASEDGE